jgi:hypothetical protein
MGNASFDMKLRAAANIVSQQVELAIVAARDLQVGVGKTAAAQSKVGLDDSLGSTHCNMLPLGM